MELIRIIHKIHGAESNRILAVADKELCGKTLKSEKIEFVVSDSFYNGKEITETELKKILHEFENINLVGNKAVGIAIEEKLVSQENIVIIQGVKHVQIFKI